MITRSRGPVQNRVVTSPRGLGAWDFDPMTGEWVELPDTSTGTPVFTVEGTTTAPPTPMLDPNRDDGLPGKPACNPNGLYPTGHRCAILQQYKDAQAVIGVVNAAAAGNRPLGSPATFNQSLNRYGADAAKWISQNTAIFAAGLLVLLVLGGKKGKR